MLKLQAIATIVLSGILGLLIFTPIAASISENLQVPVALAFLALGLLSGYRKREQKFYFYFVLFAVPILCSVLLGALVVEH